VIQAVRFPNPGEAKTDLFLSRLLLSNLSDNVEDEVRSVLARPEYFIRGPLPFRSECGGAAWRRIHGPRRKLLIGMVAGRRASLFAAMIG
jgi:hypothetical protein